jgi:hypothetical protein
MSSSVPWNRPTFGRDEPPNAWFTGRAERQARGPLRFDVLQRRLATALGLHPDDPLVIRAVAEVSIGITIEVAYLEFTRISDNSVAITDRGGETQFLNLDTGEYR